MMHRDAGRDSAGLAERLEVLRDHSGAIPAGAAARLDDLRALLDAAQAEAAELGETAAGEALGRLGVMVEVWECLAVQEPGSDEPLPPYFFEALDRLAGGVRAGQTGAAAAWALDESARRWGDYLSLVDPSWSPEAAGIDTEETPEVEAETGVEEEPEIAPSELLRRLTGLVAASGSDAGAEEFSGADEPAPCAAPPDCGTGIGLETRTGTDRRQSEPVPVPNGKATTNGATGMESEPPEPREMVGREDPVEQARTLEIDPGLRGDFLDEGADLFGRIQDLVLGLGGGDESERLHELGRCYHTLKGAAGSLGLTALSGSIHALEDRLEEAGREASAELVRDLEASLMEIERVLDALRAPEPADRPSRPEVRAEGASAEGSTSLGPDAAAGEGRARPGSTPAAGDGSIRVNADHFEDLIDLSSELIARRQFWVEQADRIKQFSVAALACNQRLRINIERLGTSVASGGPFAGSNSRPVLEGVEEELSGLIARLSEQADDLMALAATARETAIPLADEAGDLSRLSLQLWDTLQAIRIVPVRGLFQRLVRVARDAARIEGRQVEVLMTGEETGADRPLLDRVFEPLLHVVRNAVGHGIEAPEDRVRAGKPPAGRLRFGAHREGNTLVLSVQDDGRGLDDAAIAAKARRLGLLGSDEPASAAQLHALIFHPGFSTRQEASEVSGRGVGMDVVAREVAALRGRIELDSRPGQGTRVTLRLPARLSLEQVMVARVAGQAVAVPIQSIRSIHGLDEAAPGGEVGAAAVTIADQRLPLVDLRSALGLSRLTVGPRPTLLVVQAGDEPAAVLVDGVDGSRELVIRPLGPLLAGHPVISGASLTTSGEVVLALDLAGLARLCRAGGPRMTPEPDETVGGTPALVVDDSLSVRRIATRHLRALGLEVDEAIDGEQALGKLRSRSYRLVLTDLEMPRMDGFELLTELARTGMLATTPVVVTSTRSDPATRRRALDLGARAFIAKPVSAEELAGAIVPLIAEAEAPQGLVPARA